MSSRYKSNTKIIIYYTVLFPILADIIFVLDILLDALPNIHLGAMLIIVYTVVFRFKALIPIYLYVLMTGLFYGFSAWWIGYLYVWTVLWAAVMLLPKKMHPAIATLIYCCVSGLFGLMFGALLAPTQALFFGLSFKQTVAWIVAGLPYDALHCAGNTAASLLCVPLIKASMPQIKK